MKKTKKGFTLIELLIVIGIIAIIAGIIFVAIDPSRRIKDTLNARRWLEIDSIARSIKQYQADHNGDNPTGLNNTLKMIGTDASGCSVDCGSTSEIYYFNPDQTLNYYSNNTYSVRTWFDITSTSNFNSLTVSVVLDCDGSCSGPIMVRIGNASSYNDYTLVNASQIRTDGTTSNRSWYTNTYPIAKTSLGNYFFVQLLKYTGSGTVRFLMDESGPTGPDSEYRTSGNGDGSQAGWSNDNGDYFMKIGVPEKTADACLNLNSSLVDQYFKALPVDPKTGSDQQTFYAVKLTASGGAQAVACSAENNEEIQIIR